MPATAASSRPIAVQGLHHVTLVGADRRTSIDFWQGLLGMPFVFEQPNLDDPSQGHLYFDPGDGRLITVFTHEGRVADGSRVPTEPGCVHHIAFAVSRATLMGVAERLDARGIGHTGIKDRGFMDSLYFSDPLGLTIELAAYRFEPPEGYRVADVMLAAHRIRVRDGAMAIEADHIAAALEMLTAGRDRLSPDDALHRPPTAPADDPAAPS